MKEESALSDLVSLPSCRIRANAVGSLLYYTGKPCGKGHVSSRYSSSANCTECIAEKKGKLSVGSGLRVSVENSKRAAAALSSGLTTYTPNKPCRNGHLERFSTTGNCVACDKEARDRTAGNKRWARIKKIYGVTRLEYESLITSQGERCAICETHLTEKNSHLDHCHSTGKIRSILCSRCNQGIGLLNESPDLMIRAAEYIRSHK